MTETILARPLHGDEAAMRRALSKDARTSRAAIMPEPHAAPATVRIRKFCTPGSRFPGRLRTPRNRQGGNCWCGHGVHAAWPALVRAAPAASSPAQVAHRQPAARARTRRQIARPPGSDDLARGVTHPPANGSRSPRPQPVLATLPADACYPLPVHAAVSAVPKGLHRRPDPP